MATKRTDTGDGGMRLEEYHPTVLGDPTPLPRRPMTEQELFQARRRWVTDYRGVPRTVPAPIWRKQNRLTVGLSVQDSAAILGMTPKQYERLEAHQGPASDFPDDVRRFWYLTSQGI